MKYFTYGRHLVDGKWNDPTGHLSAGSICGVEYNANYYGKTPDDNLDALVLFDPTEISKAMWDEAVAAQPSTTGSL